MADPREHIEAGRPHHPRQWPIELRLEAPEDEIEDAPSVYICVNTFWVSRIIALLEVINRYDVWIGDEAEQERATQNIERFLSKMACEDCSDFLTDISIDPATGQIRVKKPGGGGWQNATGEGGGSTTTINNQNTLVQNMYPPEPVDNGLSAEERACNIASGLSDWMAQKFNDALDIIEATADIIAAADAVFGIFPPAYFIADQADDAVNEVIEATVNALRAAFDTDQIEALLCSIYCAIKDDGVVGENNIQALKDAISECFTGANAGLLQPAFNAMFLDGLENAAIIHRAMLYQSVGSAVNCALLCLDCFGGGCSTFIDGDPAWEITLGSLLSSGCDGGNGVENGGSGEIEIWFTLPQSRPFGQISFNSHNGSGTTTSILEIYEDTTLIATILNVTGGGGATCNHNSFNASGATGNKVRFYETCAAYTEWSNLTACWD